LVGLSFAHKIASGYYIPCPADQQATAKILEQLKPLFDDTNKLWVGQNIKYDLIVMKWYGVELKGEIFDTMLAHYLIEPEGRRNMDLLECAVFAI
jgi:DNA polymerase-1